MYILSLRKPRTKKLVGGRRQPDALYFQAHDTVQTFLIEVHGLTQQCGGLLHLADTTESVDQQVFFYLEYSKMVGLILAAHNDGH